MDNDYQYYYPPWPISNNIDNDRVFNNPCVGDSSTLPAHVSHTRILHTPASPVPVHSSLVGGTQPQASSAQATIYIQRLMMSPVNGTCYIQVHHYYAEQAEGLGCPSPRNPHTHCSINKWKLTLNDNSTRYRASPPLELSTAMLKDPENSEKHRIEPILARIPAHRDGSPTMLLHTLLLPKQSQSPQATALVTSYNWDSPL